MKNTSKNRFQCNFPCYLSLLNENSFTSDEVISVFTNPFKNILYIILQDFVYLIVKQLLIGETKPFSQSEVVLLSVASEYRKNRED